MLEASCPELSALAAFVVHTFCYIDIQNCLVHFKLYIAIALDFTTPKITEAVDDIVFSNMLRSLSHTIGDGGGAGCNKYLHLMEVLIG